MVECGLLRRGDPSDSDLDSERASSTPSHGKKDLRYVRRKIECSTLRSKRNATQGEAVQAISSETLSKVAFGGTILTEPIA